MSISLFNPFSLKKESEYQSHKIQEVIYYAEARFRSILVDISRTDIDRIKWTLRLLQRELVRNSGFFSLRAFINS